MNKVSGTLLHQLFEICDKVELAILLDWLCMPRPRDLQRLEHEWHGWNDDAATEGSGPVRLMRNESNGEGLPRALSNAATRLGLSKIQHRLPQRAAFREGGRLIITGW